MSRSAVCCFLLLFLGLSFGCGRKAPAYLPPQPEGMAVLTLADEEKQILSPEDRVILQQVTDWLDRDLGRRLRDRGFAVTNLRDRKKYSTKMGALMILEIKSFEPGIAARPPHQDTGGLPSALIVKYRLLDRHGAILDLWQDGAESIKGGTYCARTLNLRATARIAASYRKR